MPPKMHVDLKPCPKCGNEATIRTCPAQAGCSSWLCAFKGPKTRKKQEAADAWNRLDRIAMPKSPTVPIYPHKGPAMAKPKTVRVRIAVVVNADGQWTSGGLFIKEKLSDERLHEYAAYGFDDVRENHDTTYFIEADVPIPQIPEAQTIEGKVIDAE